MTALEENYSNVVEFQSKILSIFKAHIEYTENFAREFKSLFQIGKSLESEYTLLIERTSKERESSSSQLANTLMLLQTDTTIDKKMIKIEPDRLNDSIAVLGKGILYNLFF